MKKFLNIFFVTLGVIFFILILIGGYFFVTDPLNLKPMIFGTDSSQLPEQGDYSYKGVDQDGNIVISPAQEQALETLGVDPTTVPAEISPEQEACFVETLGSERVEEIKSGGVPTALDFLKASSCI